MARYKLISCNIFQRELCAAIADTPHVIDPVFLELGLHEEPERLRELLQGRVDQATESSERASAPADRYEAILLGYGLCGNSLAGLEARSLPLILARAHDCCAILLGSRREFLARFGDSLSSAWSSAGNIERGSSSLHLTEFGRRSGIGLGFAELEASHGEENARYLWEILHQPIGRPEIRYIETTETAALGYSEAMREKADAEGKDFVHLIGSSRLLRGLVNGPWDMNDYLVVPPGYRIEACYDFEHVFEAKRAPLLGGLELKT
jgi:Protein of unknown function (DUF1638)